MKIPGQLSVQINTYWSSREKNSNHRGLQDLRTEVCDAGDLPFGNESLDAVLCRFGPIFSPETASTVRELARVARPGAKICAAYSEPPQKNTWATTIMSIIAKHVTVPPPPAVASGLFRCAPDGLMHEAFVNEGLNDVTEEEVATTMIRDTPER